jgi:hypothetical protein
MTYRNRKPLAAVAAAVTILALTACSQKNDPVVAPPASTTSGASSSPTVATPSASLTPTASSTAPSIPSASVSEKLPNAFPSPTPTTALPEEPPQVVAAAGDIACPAGPKPGKSCQQQAVSDAIAADIAVTTVLVLGDNQYDKGSAQDYRNSYDKSWGRFKAKTRPVPGNHEYKTKNAAGYYDYFGALAGPRGKGYYSYDVGAWHFIALNSEIDLSSSGNQLAWLRADLKANPAKCVAAYWHRPRWSTGSEHGDYPKVSSFIKALYDANADLVLDGHDHDYERFQPLNPAGKRDDQRGIVEIVSGLGGKSHYSVSGRSTTAAKNDTAYGYTRLVLHADSADISFEPAVGSYRDSYTLTCH